ncbi:DUF6226 family protein [Mycobacterium kyorinense]|uniref:Uncharacterized protein n=1 Tax=Mycobacterium kyorinense TaxID=487514 RepID=A0A1X1YB27_9MYCO|nr:DUF6226 family protein [Mycobacterium kyorinense]ORW08275.1 hypothetical protein AWC14_23685 [Mycobacterium kyorinense]
MSERWGSDGPPEEAYGRVTDPERYRRLHVVGRALLDDLERRFEVTRQLSTENDPHSASPAPVVRLTPADPAASPLTIVFTAFPGLLVRMGHDGGADLPACGCDACDETAEQCEERLRDYADVCIAGAFGERIVHNVEWWHEHWYRFRRGHSLSLTPVNQQQLDVLRQKFTGDELRWAPWPQRTSDG